MANEIVIIWGPPGAGKSLLRSTSRFEGWRHFDMADHRSYQVPARVQACMGAIQRAERDRASIVVEGLFMPRSQGRKAINDWARRTGSDIEWISVFRDFEACRAGIMAGPALAQAGRLEMLAHCAEVLVGS